jgi:hypothetical protein
MVPDSRATKTQNARNQNAKRARAEKKTSVMQQPKR